MKFSASPLPGLILFEHQVWDDERGYFLETFNSIPFSGAGIDHSFVQDNLSQSKKGVLRGLHAQKEPHGQGKLVRVIKGKVWDVAVDIRKTSPTFGQYFGIELNAEKPFSMWIPPGFLHGFVALEEDSIFSYKVSKHYHRGSEIGVRYDDPDLQIAWPKVEGGFLVSEKDMELPLMNDFVSPF